MQSRHTFTGASYHSSTLAGDPFSAAGLSDLENRLVRRDACLLNGVDIVVEVDQFSEQALDFALPTWEVEQGTVAGGVKPRSKNWFGRLWGKLRGD